jgi:serine phosphatase RsbU (regulator of sigma subunit)
VDPSLNPLNRPLGRLLRLAQHADPQRIVDTLALTVAEFGGTDVRLLLIDYQRATLHPASSRDAEVLRVEGTLAGRSFTTGQPQAVPRDGRWEVWVPVSEGAQRIGVLGASLPAWDTALEDLWIELGLAAGHLVRSATAYTDRWQLIRRSRPMGLAAEMQWSLLPPLAFTVGGTTVAGLLEPAYDVAGDSFDYSLNDDLLDIVVFDAMGHGLSSSVLVSLALTTYRHARRSHGSSDVVGLLCEVDRVIADFARGDSFVTAVAATLDITSGRLGWAAAGHPQPLHIRRAHMLDQRDVTSSPPLGLLALAGPDHAPTLSVVDLEPGDGLLFYTDGVTDARDAAGEPFGEERLRDFLERASASGRPPAEALRQLILAVLGHNAPDLLRDDATTVHIRWDGAAPARR